MPKTMMVKIDDLFSAENGNSKYTKAYCNAHKGDYVVYTGTTIGVFGKVNHADYTVPNLTFTTDGEKAGTIEYINDNGYCIGGHRTILKPKSENIDLLYFKYILQPYFFQNVKRGDVPSLHFNRIKHILVPIPINDVEKYDLEKQKEIAKKFFNVESKKNQLYRKIIHLNDSKILIDNDENIIYEYLSFNKMFSLKRGNIISKNYLNEHKGVFPVYSTQKGIYGHINTYMMNGNYLLWNTDGLAGYIKQTKGPFSFTNIVGIMIPTGMFDMKNIYLDYLKWYLEPIFRDNRKGRMGINGKNEYTKLNSTMIEKLDIQIPIPLNENGEYDLDKQKELANKYATIAYIKEGICDRVRELTDIVVI